MIDLVEGHNTSIALNHTDVTRHMIRHLTPDVTYRFHVSAVSSAGVGPRSHSFLGKTLSEGIITQLHDGALIFSEV